MNPPDRHLAAYEAPSVVGLDPTTTSRTWELVPGDTVGGYEVVGRLAIDPVLGDLYEVRAPRSHPAGPLALRVLRPELALDRVFRARFRHEVRVQRQFSHPHVVPVLDGGEEGDRLFVVTPLVQAPTLARVLEAGPLAPDEALILLAPVADALDAAHAADLLHRGLTPESIVVPRAGRAMLTGFGLVGLAHRPARALEYLPPEEIESSPSTDAGDRYALAAILHESLTGLRPSVPGSPAELHAVTKSSRRRPEPLAPALGAVLADALAMEPWRRPATARELMDACGYALSHPDPVIRYAGLRRSGRIVALGAVVAAVAALAGMLTAGGGSSPATPAAAKTASANGIEVRLPAGWEVHSGASTSVPGLSVKDAVLAAPDELRGMASLVIGRRPAGGPLVGTAGFSHTIRNAAIESSPADIVELGGTQAYRFAGLRGPVAGRKAVVFVVPTLQGPAFLGCVAQAGYAGTFLRTCERVVGSAKISAEAQAIPAGEADGHDAALATALAELKGDRKAPFALLAGARSRATQATGASGVAAAYRRALRAVTAITPATVVKARDGEVRVALSNAAKWWAAAARAARRGDRALYTRARAVTTRAQRQLVRATQR